MMGLYVVIIRGLAATEDSLASASNTGGILQEQ